MVDTWWHLSKALRRCLCTESRRETVWKVRAGSISWPLEPPERCEMAPFGRFALPKNAPFDPHSDFPDSLWKVNSPKFELRYPCTGGPGGPTTSTPCCS